MVKSTQTCPYNVKKCIHGGMHVNKIATLRWKESRHLWFVHFFASFFNFSFQSLCFSTGLRPFWGFFGLRKASGLAQAKKAPKRPHACRKTQTLQASVEKNPAKKWTHHKKSPLSFHLWSAIVFTCIPPWNITFCKKKKLETLY